MTVASRYKETFDQQLAESLAAYRAGFTKGASGRVLKGDAAHWTYAYRRTGYDAGGKALAAEMDAVTKIMKAAIIDLICEDAAAKAAQLGMHDPVEVSRTIREVLDG